MWKMNMRVMSCIENKETKYLLVTKPNYQWEQIFMLISIKRHMHGQTGRDIQTSTDIYTHNKSMLVYSDDLF